MDRHDLDQLDGWLDGRLDPDHAAAFARRLARDPELRAEADRQRAVDASLRRAFEPPAAIAGPLPTAPTAGQRRRPWLAAVAAALVGVGLWAALGGGDEEPAPRPDVARLQPRAPAEVPAAPTGPDVESLYARVVDTQAARPDPNAVFQWGAKWAQPPRLRESLAVRYDECLDVETPSSCAFLGPFAAPEWPSATVLVVVCADDVAWEQPSLLVVDDQSMTGCGFEPRVGSLQPFYKEENGLAVWEFTPRSAPRFLDAIRACPQ